MLARQNGTKAKSTDDGAQTVGSAFEGAVPRSRTLIHKNEVTSSLLVRPHANGML